MSRAKETAVRSASVPYPDRAARDLPFYIVLPDLPFYTIPEGHIFALIDFLIREITGDTAAYFWIAERAVYFMEISTEPGIVPGRCGGRVQCARAHGPNVRIPWPDKRAPTHCTRPPHRPWTIPGTVDISIK